MCTNVLPCTNNARRLLDRTGSPRTRAALIVVAPIRLACSNTTPSFPHSFTLLHSCTTRAQSIERSLSRVEQMTTSNIRSRSRSHQGRTACCLVLSDVCFSHIDVSARSLVHLLVCSFARWQSTLAMHCSRGCDIKSKSKSSNRMLISYKGRRTTNTRARARGQCALDNNNSLLLRARLLLAVRLSANERCQFRRPTPDL